MRLKVALTILAFVSSGMNFSPASFCAFHCGWYGQVSAVQHLQMASQPTPEAASSPGDDEHQKPDCAACISNVGISFNPAANCLGLAQMDVLAEAFFSFAPSRVAASIDVAQPLASASSSAGASTQSRCGVTFAPDRTSVTFPAPLRI